MYRNRCYTVTRACRLASGSAETRYPPYIHLISTLLLNYEQRYLQDRATQQGDLRDVLRTDTAGNAVYEGIRRDRGTVLAVGEPYTARDCALCATKGAEMMYLCSGFRRIRPPPAPPSKGERAEAGKNARSLTLPKHCFARFYPKGYLQIYTFSNLQIVLLLWQSMFLWIC